MATIEPNKVPSRRVLSPLTILAVCLSLLFVTACKGGASAPPPPPPPPGAATPTIWPVGGSYSPAPGSPLSITLTDATPGATIYYTTDGTSPSASSNKYSASFSISATTTVQATALASGYSQSGIASATFTIPAQAGNGAVVSVFVTTNDSSKLLAAQSNQVFATASGGSNVIVVDETQTFQLVEGFGASTTDSSAYLLKEVASPAALASTMSDLFTRTGNGIGLSFIRNPMGASDLARSMYSFDDNGGAADLTLTNFSIAPDQKDIIPLVLQAKQLNPQIKIMATPWSPPAWMKSPASMIGGSLLTDASTRTAYANYFVKYVQAYVAAGIPVDYISLQNEPLNPTTDYPGMVMDAQTQALLLKNYVLPALSSAGLSTKVLLYDHNWDKPIYPQTILSDPALASSTQIAGTAWHGYGGTSGVMTTLQNSFLTLGNYQTEHSGGTWVTNQTREDFEEMIQVMRNFGKAYVKWGLALDQNRGPHTGGCGTCSGIVTVNTSTKTIAYGTEFYTLGHFSKFILPGATRVFSTNANGIVSAAFVNAAPDSSRVLVVFNDSASTQTFQAQWGTQSFTYTLPSLAGATFRWSGTQSGSYSVSAKSQMQASSYNTLSSLQTELTTDAGGGYDLGYSSAGSYAVYKSINFGTGVTSVNARLACDASIAGAGNCGGTLEFHLDSAAGPLVSSVTIPSTGGWQSWQTATASTSGATGTHDLYIVFKAPNSGTSALGNLNWFQFN
jgi:glucosylceramidase